MITDKQLQLFQVFAKHPFAELTLAQVRTLTKEKSNNTLEMAFAKFREEKLFIQRQVGRSILYKLDLSNALNHSYIVLANNARLDYLAKRSVRFIEEELERYTPFFAIVVFGSYAIGKQTKNSDLDIAVFIDRESKDIEIALASVTRKSLLTIDGHVITRKDFVQMLTNEEENLGKQIARKHMAIHNPRIFYDIIREGAKHGFNLSTISEEGIE